MSHTLSPHPIPPPEAYKHGGDYHDYLEKNPHRLGPLLKRLGVPNKKTKKKIRRLVKVFPTCAHLESLNQILAVIDHEKPLWFGNAGHLRLFLSEFPPQKHSPTHPLLFQALQPYGLFGKPTHVHAAAAELQRIQRNPSLADHTFHRKIGRLLGYPPQDVETFIDNLPTRPPHTPT